MSFRARALVVFRLTAGDAQCLPLRRSQVFSEEDDLSDMLRVMSQRTVEGLYHRERLLADRYGTQNIVRLKRSERGKYVRPCLFPPAHDLFAGEILRDFEFPIA